MTTDLAETRELIKNESAFVDRLLDEVGKVVVGQKRVVERLLIALFCNGHVLLEGMPGLAKTLTCKSLATAIRAKFQRIQFTPDLLPADVVGTMIYNIKEQTFEARRGPIFSNFILADEINRAPAKVQSALLEAMQERQVTIGDQTWKLDDPFIVLATQNPIEQEGTYPLPEAQVDRFLFKLSVGYPSRDEERGVLDRMAFADPATAKNGAVPIDAVVDLAEIRRARQLVDLVYMDDKVKHYILDLVAATRNPSAMRVRFNATNNGKTTTLDRVIQVGASPRATLALAVAARAHAFLRHRAHATPDDVKAIGLDVLRHRIILTYEAEAEELTTDAVVRQIFDQIPVP